jgi:DNA-binding transcriptional regulator YhcF (GntR family)
MKNRLFLKKVNKKLFLIFPILILLFFFSISSANAQQLKSGSLSINSNPSEAKVYLDNDYKGKTPLNLKNISTGQYSLRMSLAGYEDWTSTVVVLPILNVRISADLVPLPQEEKEYGSISVNSNPQEARVYLDNAYKGNTPINIRDVSTGRHKLRIKLAGYEDWVSEITVSSSRVLRVSADLKSQEEQGSISINSDPQGADIYLDDKYEGLTPLNLQDIASGEYEVKISLPGYEEWVEEVTVSPSRTARVYTELESRPDYGSIAIYCDQKDAKVFLNGTYKKTITKTPTVLEEIESGNYEIVIIKDGFRAWVKDIEVFIDETTTVDAPMTEIFR